MINFFCKIRVARRLGLRNIMTVITYRLMLRTGLMKIMTPVGEGYHCEPFWMDRHERAPATGAAAAEAALEKAEKLLQGLFAYFHVIDKQVGSPPAWFANPLQGTQLHDWQAHWTSLADFAAEVGDIKVLWELARFGWAPDFARAYRLSGDPRFSGTLNAWVADWVKRNPLNRGPNWKCGQEAAIRMQHLLLSAYLLQQHASPNPELVVFVEQHCRRIEMTLSYALAQDNNHATSEAAALFVGGAWLRSVAGDSRGNARHARWCRKGRARLEQCAERLITADGSFSQQSTVYHRVVVDTLNLVEFWRRTLGEAPFSSIFQVRVRALGKWLARITDPDSGDAPNLGANDGSLLFHLTACAYRDFRPSVQLSAALFDDSRAYPEGPWDEALLWLDIELPQRLGEWSQREACQYKDGGYVVFSAEHNMSWGVLRYPNYRFRPGHADALHLDLWFKGVNLLRDSGTYSYNSGDARQAYFGSTSAHNSVELDGRDQMPRLGRFLRGCWLEMAHMDDLVGQHEEWKWSGGYVDYQGGRHSRAITYADDCWCITDEVSGYRSHAILRWRLAPGDWFLDGNSCHGEGATLEVHCNREISRAEIVEGWESRAYWQKSVLPVWELEVQGPAAVFETRITFGRNAWS